MNTRQNQGLGVERQVVDINALDQLVRDELDKVEGAGVYGVTLWGHKPDETGANWNVSVKRIGDNRSLDPKLRDVLPKLRATFSLDGEGGRPTQRAATWPEAA